MGFFIIFGFQKTISMSNAKKKEEITDESTIEKPEDKKDPRPVCGLIMPIADTEGYPVGHWKEVKKLYISVAEEEGFRARLVSDSDDVRIIQKNIVQNVFDDDIVICDVSSKNPNVMFELGLRLAFDKAAVIVKDNVTGYSFDTSPIAHINYPKDLRYYDIEDFRVELKAKLKATFEESKKSDHSMYLDSFGKFVVKKLSTNEVSNDQFVIESLKEIKEELSSIKSQKRTDKQDLIENNDVSINLQTYARLHRMFPKYVSELPEGISISPASFYKYVKDSYEGTGLRIPSIDVVSKYIRQNTV